jgi:hypothetical protein
MKPNREGIPSLIEEVRASQRNTIWPDTVRNSRNVDAFLWLGPPNAKPVQRIGAVIIGLFFLLIGLGTLVLAYDRQSLIQLLVGLSACALGARVTIKAFRKDRPKHSRRP